MNLKEWKPIYNEIMDDFGFSKENDLKSAYLLRDIIKNTKNNIELDNLENIIKNKIVINKFKVEIPNTIEGILKCTNPNCITNMENVAGKFEVEDREPLKIRCVYCEKFLNSIEVRNIREA